MIDGNLTIVITLQKVLRALLEGGYYKPFPGITAGIIRMRVLFEGGSYMRKYGIILYQGKNTIKIISWIK